MFRIWEVVSEIRGEDQEEMVIMIHELVQSSTLWCLDIPDPMVADYRALYVCVRVKLVMYVTHLKDLQFQREGCSIHIHICSKLYSLYSDVRRRTVLLLHGRDSNLAGRAAGLILHVAWGGCFDQKPADAVNLPLTTIPTTLLLAKLLLFY